MSPREFAKWRAHQAMAPLEMAVADPEFGLIVLEWLRDRTDNHRARAVVGFLSETEDGQELVRAVQKGHETDPAVHLAALAAVLAARPRSEPI